MRREKDKSRLMDERFKELFPFVYGLLFCLIYQRTGSIVVAAMTHASVNTVIFGGAILLGW